MKYHNRTQQDTLKIIRLRLRRFICGFSRYIKIHKMNNTSSNSNEATNNHNDRHLLLKSKI